SAPRSSVDLDRATRVLRQRVAPVAERALGELHDVALVHQGDALSLMLDRVRNRGPDEARRALETHRLDANTDRSAARPVRAADRLPKRGSFRLGAETDLLERLRELLLEEVEQPLRFGRARRPFDAGVDVFGVLPEDHHVDLLGALDRRRHAL